MGEVKKCHHLPNRAPLSSLFLLVWSTDTKVKLVSLVMWTQCPSGCLLSVPGTGASGKSKSIHGKDTQHPHTTESQAPSPLLPVPVVFGYSTLSFFTGDLPCIWISGSTEETEASLTMTGRKKGALVVTAGDPPQL